jgi:hypothetical protein
MDVLKFALLISLQLSAASVAAESSVERLLSSKLIALTQGAPPQITQQAGRGIIVSLFSPECLWCERQIQSLNHYADVCRADWQISLVGIRGDKQALQKVLRRTQNKLVAYMATAEFLAAAPISDATPTTFFIDSKQTVVAVQRGFMALGQRATNNCDLLAHNNGQAEDY